MSNLDKEFENQSLENESGIDLNTDDSISGSTHLNEPIAEEDEVEKLKNEIASLKDKYLRQAAEFDNFRKRSSKERLEMMQTAGKDVIIPLLSVVDDCDRAEKQFAKEQDPESLKEGVRLVFQKLRSTLQARGVKAMESVGQPFDADKHEAITEIPAPNTELQGKVLDEIEKGYYLNDKIIRFAKVVVGK